MARKNSVNPYGGGGATGITLPPYFKPTSYGVPSDGQFIFLH